jgi:uncharacterized protein (UPF0548 family)
MVQRRDGQAPWFSVTAFSRPAQPLLRIAAPAGHLIQRRFLRRYLAGMATALG